MKKLLIFIPLILLQHAVAQIPPRPQPPRLYNNLSKEYPDFLSAGEAASLEEKLEVFSNETSNQIAVVIVDDLAGTDASDFAFKLGNEWGVGKKGFNNGIVVLVKPTGGAGQRDLFIATGYGLEGAIPDLMTKRIREQEMYPYMKEGRNYEALDRGTDLLMKLAKGEISTKDYSRQDGNGRRIPILPLIIVFILFILLRNRFRGGGGGHTYSGRGRSLFWGTGFGGSRGWGGGSSGGGWGGFGGGGFGGGGSGGKW